MDTKGREGMGLFELGAFVRAVLSTDGVLEVRIGLDARLRQAREDMEDNAGGE